MPRRLSALLAAALALPAVAQDAAEPIIRMDNPAALALALREEGYRAKLSKSDSGRPMILSGTSGVNYDIHFYFCDDDGVACEGLLFSAGFDLRNGIGLAAMNDWNRDRLVGRAFTDEDCDPTIDFFISTDGEFLEKEFLVLLADWDKAVTDFREFIGFGDEDGRIATDCANTDAI